MPRGESCALPRAALRPLVCAEGPERGTAWQSDLRGVALLGIQRGRKPRPSEYCACGEPGGGGAFRQLHRDGMGGGRSAWRPVHQGGAGPVAGCRRLLPPPWNLSPRPDAVEYHGDARRACEADRLRPERRSTVCGLQAGQRYAGLRGPRAGGWGTGRPPRRHLRPRAADGEAASAPLSAGGKQGHAQGPRPQTAERSGVPQAAVSAVAAMGGDGRRAAGIGVLGDPPVAQGVPRRVPRLSTTAPV